MKYFILLFLILYSCKQKNNPEKQFEKKDSVVIKAKNTSTKDSVILSNGNNLNKTINITHNKNESCLSLLRLLITKTKIANEIPKDFNIAIDDTLNNIYVLKIYNSEGVNEEPIKWLNLNFNSMKLEDVTSDPDKPININFDSTIYNSIKNCNLK